MISFWWFRVPINKKRIVATKNRIVHKRSNHWEWWIWQLLFFIFHHFVSHLKSCYVISYDWYYVCKEPEIDLSGNFSWWLHKAMHSTIMGEVKRWCSLCAAMQHPPFIATRLFLTFCTQGAIWILIANKMNSSVAMDWFIVCVCVCDAKHHLSAH